MDMVMVGVAVALILLLLGLGVVAFVAIRVLGARETRGDHPGEKGYDPAQHRPRPS